MLGEYNRITFNPDTTEEQDRIAAAVQPILNHMHKEAVETKTIYRPLPDGSEEVTLYVNVYTNDVYGLMFRLSAAGLPCV